MCLALVLVLGTPVSELPLASAHQTDLGLQWPLWVPAQIPTSTRDKMISSKARATLLTPIRMAGMIAKILLISNVPFLQDSRAQRTGCPAQAFSHQT